MKTVTLLFLALLATSLNQDKLEKYSKAYNYIKNTRIAGEFFATYYDSLITTPYKICVSNKLYYIEKQSFIDEILDMEYINSDDASKRKALDSLATIEVKNIQRNLEDFIIYSELDKFNECGSECDLELFFGEFDNQNRLRATLIPNDNKFRKYYGFEPQCGTEYLFYFLNNDIVKVFCKNFQK